MGLLDKASRQQPSPAGGLLSRAQHSGPSAGVISPAKSAVPSGTVKKKRTENQSAPSDKPVPGGIIRLAAGISQLTPSLEGMGELFELLKKAFSIKKGALLTRSTATEFFLPRAQTGLDITSRNRLRLPPDLISESTERGSWVVPEELTDIQPYLSSREHALIEGAFILPVYSENFCSGMIIILTDAYDNGKMQKLTSLPIHPVQEAIGSYFNRIKLFHLTKAPETAGGPLELEKFIHKMRENQMVFTAVQFNIAPLLKRLQTASHDVDLFRARKDTLRIIETLFEGSSILVPLNADAYLLLLGTKRQQNPGLLQHQVALALQNFFSDSKTVLEFTTISPPPSDKTPKQAASDLINAG